MTGRGGGGARGGVGRGGGGRRREEEGEGDDWNCRGAKLNSVCEIRLRP